ARQPEGSPLREALLEEYEYDGLETCAVDGSCQLACPVGIDTGTLVKELRAAGHGERAERRALAAARRWQGVEGASRAALRIAGPRAGRRGRARGRREAPPSKLPMPLQEGAAAVYVPPCTSRIFGGSPVEALVELSRRAGLPVWIPEDADGT